MVLICCLVSVGVYCISGICFVARACLGWAIAGFLGLCCLIMVDSVVVCVLMVLIHDFIVWLFCLGCFCSGCVLLAVCICVMLLLICCRWSC